MTSLSSLFAGLEGSEHSLWLSLPAVVLAAPCKPGPPPESPSTGPSPDRRSIVQSKPGELSGLPAFPMERPRRRGLFIARSSRSSAFCSRRTHAHAHIPTHSSIYLRWCARELFLSLPELTFSIPAQVPRRRADLYGTANHASRTGDALPPDRSHLTGPLRDDVDLHLRSDMTAPEPMRGFLILQSITLRRSLPFTSERNLPRNHRNHVRVILYRCTSGTNQSAGRLPQSRQSAAAGCCTGPWRSPCTQGIPNYCSSTTRIPAIVRVQDSIEPWSAMCQKHSLADLVRTTTTT